MKNVGLISIIVPVYGIEKYLAECVDSILSQTYENLEVILVDDESPDNCPKICDEWAKKDSRIKVIHKENGGVSSARNIGLDNATGEYIAFVDSDDFLDLDYYEKMFEDVDFSNVDLVVSNTRKVRDDNMKEGAFFNKETININNQKELCEFAKQGFLFQLWNKIYKKNLIKQKFDESVVIGEDKIFNLNYLEQIENKVICVKNNLFYNYVIYSGSCYHREREGIYEVCTPHIQKYKEFLEIKFGNYSNNNYFLTCMKDYMYIVMHCTKKEKKAVFKKVKNDKLFKECVKKAKTTGLKLKVKKVLLMLGMFNSIRTINRIKNR